MPSETRRRHTPSKTSRALIALRPEICLTFDAGVIRLRALPSPRLHTLGRTSLVLTRAHEEKARACGDMHVACSTAGTAWLRLCAPIETSLRACVRPRSKIVCCSNVGKQRRDGGEEKGGECATERERALSRIREAHLLEKMQSKQENWQMGSCQILLMFAIEQKN
jgi:hypothetical protein